MIHRCGPTEFSVKNNYSMIKSLISRLELSEKQRFSFCLFTNIKYGDEGKVI